MASPHASPTATSRFNHQRNAGAPLTPRWLALARAVWIGAAILALATLLASIPGYVLVASQGNFAGRVIDAPAGLVRLVDLTGVVASFASALVCCALAALLYWRKPRDWMALFLSFYLLIFGIAQAGPLERLDTLIPGLSYLAVTIIQPILLTWPTIALLVLFPNGRCVPPWTRWLLVLAIPLIPLTFYIMPTQSWLPPLNWLLAPASMYFLLIVCAALYAQFYRYRHISSPTERQQTKWAIAGLALWVFLVVVESAPYLVMMNDSRDAALSWWAPVTTLIWWLSLDVVPLTLTVAVLRHHLFDIDVIIRRTLVYGTLTTILGAIYVLGVVGAQTVLHALTGQQTAQSPLIIVATTLLVAALFTPLRRSVQTVIDRRFYRRRYDAARTIAAFDSTLHTEADLRQITERLVAVAEETMQPTHISLWLNEPASDAERRAQLGVTGPAQPAGVPSSPPISAGPRLAYPDTERQLAPG
jgi:hypothetical protein